MTFLAEVFGLAFRAGGGFGAEGSVVAHDAPVRGQRAGLGGDLFFRGAGDDVEEDTRHEGAGAVGVVPAGQAIAQGGHGEHGAFGDAGDFLRELHRSRQQEATRVSGIGHHFGFHVRAEFGGPRHPGAFHAGSRGSLRGLHGGGVEECVKG